jgi:DNA-binding MarR family transcriptional regulator
MQLPKREKREGGSRSTPSSLQSLFSRNKLCRPLRLTEDHILSVISMRRARSAVLGKNLFSDPAWDILLELHGAHLGGRITLVIDLARAIETPLSTTRRWIAALMERGLVQLTTDLSDAGQVQVELTAEAIAKLEHLGNHWGSAFVSI